MKKAFTLVELLAVIVILAIILVIAIPQIMNTISSAKSGSLESSASLIASSAEQVFLTKEMLGQATSTLNCSDVANITTTDYDTCTITKVYGKVLVNIKGKGQFADKYICNGTKELSVARDEDCARYATTVVANSGNVMTDETNDKNLRYSGYDDSTIVDDMNNYVTFNGEVWRIIGIFNVSNKDGELDQRIKLVRNASLGNYSWDSSASDKNSGYGYNVWETISGQTKADGTTKADLNILLNEYYYNGGTNVTVYKGRNNASTTATFTGLSQTAKDMIDTVIWNLGGTSYSNPSTPPYGLPILDTYNAERGTSIYWSAISKTEWLGNIGLIYPSDYGYASTDSGCRSNLRSGVTYNGTSYDYSNASCKTGNWLQNGSTYWTFSPYFPYPTNAFYVYGSGYVDYFDAYVGFGVRPSVYLKSNIRITSGTGASNDPYILSAGA